MTSKSVCRRVAIEIDGDVIFASGGVAVYNPKRCPTLTSQVLRQIADTLDMLTEQKKEAGGPMPRTVVKEVE